MITLTTSVTARPASAASTTADAVMRGEPAMDRLRVAVLGPPEVFHHNHRLTFALRKAQALLLYLAVEGGMHSRSKLAALLWPDSEPHDARRTLRNAIALLRRLLADGDASASPQSPSPAHGVHLLFHRDLLGLDPQAPFELDLDVVQHAWQQAQLHSTLPFEEQRATLVTLVQHALSLVRGPFLDGFWLQEETSFDEWVLQQRQLWQVRLQLLFARLSSWQELAGELESARATLVRWLALEPLAEEAYRRLMRVHLALGDATAALQVYTTCRARLAEELRVPPSADTVALAEHIRATQARRQSSPPARPTSAESRPPSELVAPLVGRAAAFSKLVACYHQARLGQPQAVLIEGEAGIGKTRLVSEFVAWVKAQGAEVLSGHAFEMGGRLPYQPLVEALRPRLEEENAPEDLLEDLWLTELSRLLPELRGRYPDLPAASEDELVGKGRLFEAVVRLLDALARSAPLVLLLEELHWVDGASLDLLRYLAHSWKEQGRRVLLLSTMRSEGSELSPQLATHLADLGRDVPLTQVTLQPLSQAQTMHLLEAMVGQGEPGTSTGEKQRDLDSTQPAPGWCGAAPAPERETPLLRLGDFLFAQTGGQPMYLLEMLKLLRERQLLVPRMAADGRWRLEPTVEMSVAVVQEGARRELLPPSVRAMIQARLARLSPAARQVVMAAAVLANTASARRLWQTARLGVQAGVEALEEAIKSGILREEEARVGRSAHYRFTHELMREVAYTELGAARRQVLHQQALAVLSSEGARASELAYHARASGQAQEACRYSVQAGDEAVAVFAVDDAIRHYEQGRSLLQEHPPVQSELEAWEVECLYTHLGQAYAFQSAWEKAQEVYEELIAYGQQHQMPTLVSLTLNRLAILAVQQAKDQSQVRALLEEARRTAQTSHDQRALAETEWSLAQITAIWWGNPKCAFPHGVQALELARASNDKELEARSLYSLGGIHLMEGDFEEAIHCLEASLALYAALSNEPIASWDLSLPSLVVGAPPTHSLTLGAREAFCWVMLALAQVQAGQMQASIRSSRRALALAKENQNVWARVSSLAILTFGLLEVGAYEEAFVLMHAALGLARTLPQMVIFQLFVHALGSTYHALQQWEEASRTLAEAEAVAERLDLRLTRASVLSKLCMHYALVGQWEAAYRYAVEASTLRKNADLRLILLDFSLHYEIEAFLHKGDERQAIEAVQRLGEQVGPYPRFRLPYLRSRAVLAEWEGDNEQAIGHWQEAAGLAADLGLPAEQWQIQAALGRVYEVGGQHVQARAAFGEAARIIQGLAQDIGDEARRAHFLAAPPIHQVLQHA